MKKFTLLIMLSLSLSLGMSAFADDIFSEVGKKPGSKVFKNHKLRRCGPFEQWSRAKYTRMPMGSIDGL